MFLHLQTNFIFLYELVKSIDGLNKLKTNKTQGEQNSKRRFITTQWKLWLDNKNTIFLNFIDTQKAFY